MRVRMWSMAWCLWCLLLCFSSDSLAEPQENSPDVSRIEKLKAALEEQASEENNQKKMVAPVLVPREYLDEEGKAMLQASLRAYYEYRIQGFTHRQRVFSWQLLSSKIIFVVVIFLVLTGIYFSWLQFRADMLDRQQHEDQEQAVSTIEASSEGIKVSSPVLGVIILVLSLLFFYLYLQYVYPIEEIL